MNSSHISSVFTFTSNFQTYSNVPLLHSRVAVIGEPVTGCDGPPTHD